MAELNRLGERAMAVGDELLVRAVVTATWPEDGRVTIELRGGSVKFTVPEDSDDIEAVFPEKKVPPMRRRDVADLDFRVAGMEPAPWG